MLEITRSIGLVEFSGNPVMLGVRSYDYDHPFYTIFLRISFIFPVNAPTSKPIFELSASVDKDGFTSFDLSPILKQWVNAKLLWPISSSNIAWKDTDACIKFWFELRDGYGVPFSKNQIAFDTPSHAPFLAIPGGLPDHVLEDIERNNSNAFAWLSSNDIILTSQPNLKRSMEGQPEIFRFFNSSSSDRGAKLIISQTDFDGNVSSLTAWSGTLDALSMYSFNVTPNAAFVLSPSTCQWEAFLVDSSDNPISESLSWRRLDLPPSNPRTIIFQNSLGGFDSILSVGARDITHEGETLGSFVAHSSSVRRWLEPRQERRKSTSVYRGSLGFFTNAELKWLREFFASERKWLVDEEGKLQPLRLRQDSFPGETDDPPGRIDIEAEIGAPQSFFF